MRCLTPNGCNSLTWTPSFNDVKTCVKVSSMICLIPTTDYTTCFRLLPPEEKVNAQQNPWTLSDAEPIDIRTLLCHMPYPTSNNTWLSKWCLTFKTYLCFTFTFTLIFSFYLLIFSFYLYLLILLPFKLVFNLISNFSCVSYFWCVFNFNHWLPSCQINLLTYLLTY